ncbi:antibiotic biosynthesis monooxygenase [Plantibacter sp. MCCC 1A11337]|uniref:antibiotic biosynthesis monooxygenase n=1 Tax=Plantibacter sp. MCCC 1A11337 TaxID=2736644 RepID=UPI0015824C0C|nr:antibiotic biosynthesis monooxygenase [Plantibacter sp. MCCC 1A11337]NUJ87641.1 antibiotic biosynthesis monooxygenase [Plantibacter sp. MCCC 1A11337]
MEHDPITVSIERRVNPASISEATIWVQAGINLANRYPGFLGSGWVRAGAESDVWYMLYRFADEQTLTDWEESKERAWWLSSGREFMEPSRVERRSGIEGWFDAPDGILRVEEAELSGDPDPIPPAPPRWKQAVSIWLGFFPLNLVFTLLVTALVPGWEPLGVFLHVLISTLILTPIMTYWLLPLVTRLLRPWLTAPRRSRRTAG